MMSSSQSNHARSNRTCVHIIRNTLFEKEIPMQKATITKRMLGIAAIVLTACLFLAAQSVANAASITSAATGNWNSSTTWVGGIVPTSADNVTIAVGHTVTMDASAVITSLTVTGTLQFTNTTTAYTLGFASGSVLTVNGTLNMGQLGALQTGATGTTTVTMGSTANLSTSNINGLGPAAGASLQTQGAGSFILTSLATAGTVTYAGVNSANFVVTDRNYNNLTLNGAGNFTWTLAADRTILGTLLSTPSKLTLVGTQNIFLGTNLNTQMTAFDPGTSTIVLNGTAGQFINHNSPALNNLTVNKSAGTVTTFFSCTINGAFTVTAGTLTPSNTFTINGPFTNNGTVTLGASWNFNGNFTNNGTLTGSAAFAGTSPQIIGGTSPTTFGTLTINNAAGVTLAQNTTVSTALNLTAGVFTLSSPLTLGNSATITRSGVGSFSGTPVFGALINLTYSNTAAGPAITPGTEFPVSPTVLNNFTISNFSFNTTINLASDLTVNGALTLSGTQAFLNAGTQNITIKGSWTNSASTTAFNAGTGMVTWNGTSASIGGTSATTFNNLTVNVGGANTLTISTAPTVNGAFTVTSGTVALGTIGLIAKGDVVNNSSATPFTGTTGVFQFAGTTPQTLSGSFATTFPRLTMNNGAGLTLGNNATVTLGMTLTSGAISTGTNSLTLSAGTTTVTRTSGHVIGNFTKAFAIGSNVTKNFEIGTGADYTPVSLTFPSITTAGNLTATSIGTEHPDVLNSGLDVNKDVNRYWRVTNSGLVPTNYSATFNFVTTDVDPGADPTKFEVRKLNIPTWTFTTTGTRTATSTQATGLTSFSDFAVGTVIPVTPASPTLVSPANLAANLVITPTLTWNTVYGADSYGVTVATDPGFANIVINQSGLTATSYVVVTPLNNSATYYWHVTASNAAGTSVPSTDWSFTTIIAIPPAPILTAPADAATGVSTTPVLTWNSAVGAATYRVQIASDPAFSTIIIDQAGIATTSYTVSPPLGTSSPYYWHVNATNVGGTGPYSIASSFTTLLAAPAVPTLLSPANLATNVSPIPTLSWNPVLGATSYAVQVATDAGFGSLVVDQAGVTGTSFNVSVPLAPGTIHYWKVNSTNSGGTSVYSGAWSFTTRTPATITSTKTGNWNDPTAWSTGYVPSLGDGVVIASTHIIAMNASAVITSLTVTGTLQFTNTTTAYTLGFASGSVLTVNGTLNMGQLGALQTGATGTTTVTMGSTANLSTSNINGLGPAAGASLQTQGAGTFILTSLDANGTVTYAGVNSANFVVTDRNYNNLTLNGAGNFTWTLAADRTILGTLLSTPSKLTLVGTQNIFLGTNLNTQMTAFDPGTSTIVLNGTAGQFINHNSPALNNLTVNKSAGTVTTFFSCTINGAFTVTAGTLTPSNTFTINGPFTNNGSVTLSAAWTYKGDFTNNGTYSPGATITTFSGVAPQTIGGTSTTTFGGLTIANTTAAVSVATNLNVTGSLTVNANAILAPAPAVVINNAAAAGTITGSGTVQVTRTAATADFSSQYKFTTNTLTNVTVDYAGAAAQSVNALTYGGLKISNSVGATLGGNVTVGGNFTNNGVFIPSTFGVTFLSGVAQSILGSSPSSFFNLTINKSAGTGLTLGANATVNGILTLTAGNITTGTNSLTVDAGGSVVRTSGHIVGNLRKQIPAGAGIVRTFEVGTGTNYTPSTLTFANVSGAGYVTGSTTAGEHPSIAGSRINAAKSVNRYWTWTSSGVAFDTYDAGFTFVAGDVDAGANTAVFGVDKFNSPTWFAATAGTRTPTSTQAVGLTSFSDFAIGEVFPPVINVTASLTPFNSTAGTPSAEQNYTVAGSYLTGNVTITPPAGFELSLASGSGFGSTPIALMPAGVAVPSTTIYVRLNSPTPGSPSGNITHSSAGATQQDLAVSGTVTVGTYAINVAVVGNGAVAKLPDQPTYNPGTVVQLTASPSVGYSFTGWSGDLTGATNPVNITMDAAKNITATFLINVYALNLNIVGNGSVAKVPDQPSHDYGTIVQLTASPVTGYYFMGWSGDLTGTTNPVNVTMDAVKNITATFAGIKVFVSSSPSDSTARIMYPDDTWRAAVSPPPYSGADDWSLSNAQPLSFYVVPEVGATVGASDMTFEWDPAILDLQNVDFTTSVFSGPNLALATWDKLGTTNRVTINASLIAPNNAIAAPGSFLAKMNFTLKAPGHSTIASIASDVRFYNPDMSQGTVPVTQHQGEVKAYLGDVATASVSTMGDGKLDFNDFAPWSASYWSGVPGYVPAMANYKAKDDIGPTMTVIFFSLPAHSVSGVMTPGPDEKIDFEDLVHLLHRIRHEPSRGTSKNCSEAGWTDRGCGG